VLAASTARLVLDYLRVFVWPALVLFVVAYAVRRYGGNIGGLIDRIRFLKAPWLEAGFHGPQQQLAGDEEAAVERVEESKELVQAYQEEDEAHEAQVMEARLEREYLRRRLAVTEIQLDFERIYRVIYGSQIAALRSLRAAPEGSLPRGFLESHLALSKATWTAFPHIQNLTFEEWLGFLVRNELVSVPVANDLASVLAQHDTITQKGAAFLDYIDLLRLPARIF
jgi:hypothetical protein